MARPDVTQKGTGKKQLRPGEGKSINYFGKLWDDTQNPKPYTEGCGKKGRGEEPQSFCENMDIP